MQRSVRIPDDLDAELVALADSDPERDISDVIRSALRFYLEHDDRTPQARAKAGELAGALDKAFRPPKRSQGGSVPQVTPIVKGDRK
jgi:Arc/MetJ-type ribon-helix-helix transcriptional regulator